MSRACSGRCSILAAVAPHGIFLPAHMMQRVQNSGGERLDEHDLRTEISREFVDVVKGLWDTWEEGAIAADKTTGIFLDKSKVRSL